MLLILHGTKTDNPRRPKTEPHVIHVTKYKLSTCLAQVLLHIKGLVAFPPIADWFWVGRSNLKPATVIETKWEKDGGL